MQFIQASLWNLNAAASPPSRLIALFVSVFLAPLLSSCGSRATYVHKDTQGLCFIRSSDTKVTGVVIMELEIPSNLAPAGVTSFFFRPNDGRPVIDLGALRPYVERVDASHRLPNKELWLISSNPPVFAVGKPFVPFDPQWSNRDVNELFVLSEQDRTLYNNEYNQHNVMRSSVGAALVGNYLPSTYRVSHIIEFDAGNLGMRMSDIDVSIWDLLVSDRIVDE